MITSRVRLVATLGLAAALTLAAGPVAAGAAAGTAAGTARSGSSGRTPATTTAAKSPVAEGYGGAVTTVDLDATRAGISVLRRGGNAIDAAVATSAALGVTEPFVAALGGGGFLVYYDARTHRVDTIDGREFAPAAATDRLFVDPRTGKPLSFQDARVSGLSVGVPGTLATWQTALDRWGTWSLARTLQPAIGLARDGFTVDNEFRSQIQVNQAIFADFPATRALYLPNGAPPPAGSTFRNPDLAATYETLAHKGIRAFYDGPIGRDVVATVQHPPVDPSSSRVVRPGSMTLADLAAYRAKFRAPTHASFRGLDVYGPPPPSSGGTTVAETLGILQAAEPTGPTNRVTALHDYLEGSSLAYADRNRYVGDPDVVDVPTAQLTSAGFAAERACELEPGTVLPKPVAPGVPDGDYHGCGPTTSVQTLPGNDGGSTTHITVSDRWGNVVAYTFTIEQFGGNGMVVPGRGFILNNELTDFDFTPSQGNAPDPNLPGPRKRPRSSIAPTIVLRHGRPVLALGSPGGASIITTVLQILQNRIDLSESLPDALAAPRASSRNGVLEAEPAFLATPEAKALETMGFDFATNPEIGAATAIEFGPRGWTQAVAEPVRRGGGSAMVVVPVRHAVPVGAGR